MAATRPTDEQVDDQLTEADKAMEDGTRWPGMSYEDGVSAALRWAMGWSNEAPMEDA